MKNVGRTLSIFAVLGFLIIVAILARMNTKHFEQIVVTQIQEHLRTIARTESQHIEQRLIDTCGELEVLAGNPKVKKALLSGRTDKDGPMVDAYFPEELVYKHLMNNVSSLYRLDSKGVVQLKLPWEEGKAGNDYSLKPGVRTVLKNHQPYVSELFKTNSGMDCISVCVPVFEEERFIGVLRSLINLDAMHACLKDSDIGSKGYAWMIDSRGAVVSYPDTKYVGKELATELKKDFPSYDWSELKDITKRMALGEEDTGFYYTITPRDKKLEVKRNITAFVPVKVLNQLWSLGTVIEYDEISSPIQKNAKNVAVGVVILLLMFLGIGVWLYKIQTEKVQLRTEAESAEKLRLANYGLNQEIAERKLAEENLRKSEKKSRAYFKHSPVCTKIVDLEFNLKYMSRAGVEALKVEGASQFYEKPYPFSFFPESFKKSMRECLEKVKTTGEIATHEDSIVNAEGDELWFYSTIAPVTDDRGQLDYLIVVSSDITDRKNVEKELQKTETKSHAALENSPVCTKIVDLDFNLQYMSRAGIEGLGIEDITEFYGKPYPLEFYPESFRTPMKKNLKQVKETGEVITQEASVVDTEGNELWFHSTIVPVNDDQGQLEYIIVVSSDTSVRKQAEMSLKSAAEAAQAANTAKSQFLANMSHEIRTPMNAIVGFSDMLANEDLTDEQAANVGVIRESAANLVNLINDILDFSKIEAGQLDVEKTDCSLSRLLNSIESITKTQAEEKSIDFQVLANKDVPGQITSDSFRLHQCLVNLVNNALKFTEQGYVHLKVSVEERNNEHFIRFDIEDTGIGIPAQRQQAVFDSFTQADGSTTRKYGGTGLGLTVTKQLIELLGGELTLTSELGEGSVFSFTLPTGVDITGQPLLNRDIVLDQGSDVSQRAETSLFYGKVLVAEDVEGNQRLMELMLSKLGVEVVIAQDGREAVQKALSQSFDLVLMDMQMPNMNGYEATRMFRQQDSKTPVVALTANAMKGDDEKCLNAGCDGYLTKPIDRRELPRILAKYLPTKPARETIGSLHAQVDEPEQLGTEPISCPIPSSKPNKVEFNKLINWDLLIDRMGDETTIRKIMPTYTKDIQKHFEKLSHAMEIGDCTAIASHAHALKGVGRNLSIEPLSEIASQMEKAGRGNDMEASTLLFNDLRTKVGQVISTLSQCDWIESYHLECK